MTGDLTEGPVLRRIVGLAVPVGLALGLQSVYALVDLWWIAGLGQAAVGGLGIGLQLFFVVFALGQVLATPALADVSQRWGAGRQGDAGRTLASYLVVGLGVGSVTAVAVAAGAEVFAARFTTDPAVLAAAVAYLRPTALTFVTQLTMLVLASGLRGAGDFVTPLKVLVASVGLNVGLDPVLIHGLGLGVAGAAWATVLSQGVALLLYARTLGSGRTIALRRPGEVGRVVGAALARGVPAGFQFVLFAATLAALLLAARPHGATWTAGIGSGFRVLQQLLLPLFAVGTATAAVAGQAAGAGLPARVREGFRYGIAVAGACGLGGVALLALGAEPLAAWFAAPEDHAAAASFLRWAAPSLLGLAPALVVTLGMQALGRPVAPMATATLRLLLFLPLTLVAGHPTAAIAAFTVTCWLEGALDLGLVFGGLSWNPSSPASSSSGSA